MNIYQKLTATTIKADIAYAIDGACIEPFSKNGRETHEAKILNARLSAVTPDFNTHGFCLNELDFSFTNVEDEIQLHNDIKKLTQSIQYFFQTDSCLFLGHITRHEKSSTQSLLASRPPAGFVHADWNAARIKNLGHKADPFIVTNTSATCAVVNDFLTQHPQHSIINAWLPLNTVINFPLVLAAVDSVRPSDVITNISFKNEPNAEQTQGEILSLHTTDHYAWYYYPLMQSNEMLLFQQYNSTQTLENFMPTFHTAVDLFPDCNANLSPRQSIELRFLVAHTA